VGSSRGDADRRREQAEDAIVLGLLDAVEGNAAVTQRRLAQDLGIALGLANTYLKRCVRKGLLKVTEIPTRRYAYYITPQGFAEKSRLTARYLAYSFDFLRRARAELTELFLQRVQRGQRRFVLIGTGDLADVAMLVAPRSHVEVVAVIAGERHVAELKKLIAGINFDCAMVTATEFPQDTYVAAIAAFGEARVCVPPLLRIRSAQPHAVGVVNG
jgi:DNA-binding MarR family transcriptional regulator